MPQVNEGKLVRIRPVSVSDLPTLCAWKRSSEALGGFNAPMLASLEMARKHLDTTGPVTPEHGDFAIEVREDGRLVGKVGYSMDTPIRSMVRTLSVIGDPEDRGRGYATEARLLLINYLFLSTSLERIYSETDEHNKAARRSLEKCQMQFEGVLRHLFFHVGQWTNVAVYSILRADWGASELYAPYRSAFVEPWFQSPPVGVRPFDL